jgi:digeranylgeranylglycerophospholipid reductase
MDEYDVAVVGGGPIGCYVAEQLALKGRRIAVFEEHNTIGEPTHCAGLVTQRVLDITKCSQDAIVQNTIYGAIIHSPAGALLTIGGNNIHALVINRQKFDEHIAQKALNAGAAILRNHKVIAVKKQRSVITLDIQQDEQMTPVHSQLLIGADGAHSHIRDSFGFPQPIEKLHGISAELSDSTLDPKYVHIFVGSTIAPGFFAWVIPTNVQGTTARIGLCIGKHSTHPLQYYYTALLQQPLLQGTTVMKRFGGTIPLGPLKKTAVDQIMLVGDAAAQVKPTSGGGIYPGLLCATHCSIIAEEAFQKQRFDEKFLRHYHAGWTKEIGRELSLGMRFRSIFSHLTDRQFNKYIEKLGTQKTIDTINTYGDIDYPSRLVLPLLTTMPSLLSLTPTMLKHKNK